MDLKNIKLIPQIIKFAESIQEYLKIFQAFLEGYTVFMDKLKGSSTNEKEQ